MVINLIPPKIKQGKKIKKIGQTISIFLTTTFIILLILTGSIFAADFSTKQDVSKINEKIADQEKLLFRYKDVDDGIKAVNSKLGKIESANSNRILWSSLIIELSKLTPSQIQIKTLTIDQQTNKISLTGYAETRSDIARFKEKMSSSKFFKNVTFSSSVHDATQANFSFNISSEIGDTK
jgi:Tfp pilus assembly protein PilN